MVIALLAPHAHHILSGTVLYIGPDVFLPITSALAAIAGVLLMFWNRLVGLAKKLYQMVTRRSQ
jgi:undecaprenyl pyrophosphate phosphatase UppP